MSVADAARARVARWRHWAVALAAVLAIVLGAPARARDPAELVAFARARALADIDGFIATLRGLAEDGRLPARFVTKAEAERRGWRPGRDLCEVAPGRALGGDRFANREGRLPADSGRLWREADLDFACGRRGPRRLVWSSDGLFFVTLDHYRTFVRVPPPRAPP